MKRIVLVALLAGCHHSHSTSLDAGRADLSTTDASANDLASIDLNPVDLAGADLAPPACPSGATFLSTISCDGAATPPSSTMASNVQNAIRGDVVHIDPEGSVPCAPVTVCTSANAPTLLFSDEPESPTSDGVLYAATVPAGPYRVYAYHVNGASSGQRKISVVALNQGTSDVTITFGRRGSAGPSTNYVATGASAAQAWLLSSTGSTLTVPAGMRVVVDSALDARHANPDELVVGQLDFTTSDTLKISVVTVAATADAAASTASLSLLANTGKHVRGTFPSAALTFVPWSWPDDGVRHIRLGTEMPEPLSGIDAVDGNTAVTNDGDYGVPYTIVLPAGMRGYGISPRGGAWGGAASIPTGDDHPIATTTTLGQNDDTGTMTMIGRFSQPASIELLTAGGSNLPADFVIVPL